jgi:hypothetical protein
MPEQSNNGRRPLLASTALAVGGAELIAGGGAGARSGKTALSTAISGTPAARSPFGPLKQIEAGVLGIGYVDAGPRDRRRQWTNGSAATQAGNA